MRPSVSALNERYGDLSTIEIIAHKLEAGINFRFADDPSRISSIRILIRRAGRDATAFSLVFPLCPKLDDDDGNEKLRLSPSL